MIALKNGTLSKTNGNTGCLALKRDYNKNGTHPSGMWGSQEGLNPKFQSLCSKNEAAQAPKEKIIQTVTIFIITIVY